jgi:hypothetical protein
VGYVGTVEFPHSAEKLSTGVSAHYHALQSAMRRLRVEQRFHTLILMQVNHTGVKLVNAMGGMLAFYPATNVCESSVFPEDESRFFGIATTTGSPSEIDIDDHPPLGCSCHVFMVNPELSSHSQHRKEARMFGVSCLGIEGTNRCRQFPVSAHLVVTCIALLHNRDDMTATTTFGDELEGERGGVSGESRITVSSSFTASSSITVSSAVGGAGSADGTNSAPNTSGSSANTDGGRSDPSNRVCVVEMPQETQNLSVAHSIRDPGESFGWHFGNPNTSTPLKPSTTPLNMMEEPSSDRLGVRARPNPLGILSPDTQANAEQLRKTAPRVLNQTAQQNTTTTIPMASTVPDETNTDLNVTDDVKADVKANVQAPLGSFLESPIPPIPPRLPARPPTSSSFSNIHGHADLGTRKDRALSPSKPSSATIGKKTGSTPRPVAIPQVPDLSTKPPRPASMKEKRNPFTRLRTPRKPPIVERPKSTPPIRGFDPEAPIQEEEYDSDPGNLSSLTNNFEESWSGQIPEMQETPLKLGEVMVPDIRRHSEGMALLQNKVSVVLVITFIFSSFQVSVRMEHMTIDVYNFETEWMLIHTGFYLMW